MVPRKSLLIFSVCAFTSGVVLAEPIAPIKRTLPPPGKPLAAETRSKLEAELAKVNRRIDAAEYKAMLPDVQIFTSAVELALAHDEFYGEKDADLAFHLLKSAEERLDALEKNGREAPWARQSGTLVRGYISPVDGSVQPYGLVIPAKLDLSRPAPLYVWLHGRGDTKTNMAFLKERQSRVGQISPDDAIVLHPFGRHCVGFKSAGETDVLDAIGHVFSRYKIDRRKIVLIGFSMGGAGCWHVGAHYTDRFVAMSPGAGFAETARYAKVKIADTPKYEQKLWGVYDVPCYTRNLFNLPVIAYSGENDKQIQAARVMEEAFADEGEKLAHLIGPGMGHKYYPDTLAEILSRLKAARDTGLDMNPKKVSLQTRTLRYNRMHWVEVMGLEEHWLDTRVDASRTGNDNFSLTTKNVSALRLSPAKLANQVTVKIDGQELVVDLSGDAVDNRVISLVKHDGRWQVGPTQRNALAKLPKLQGPIDDAFLDPFLVVLPSGKCRHAAVQQWVEFEQEHFLKRWRALFRGTPRVKQDTDVTAEDMAKYHLILWGDPQSNAIIKRFADWGPIRWTDDTVQVGDKKFAAEHHVPIYIYPNRDALNRYIVINSGPTFREGHDRTNSLQNPKLPDWAVVDIRQPPDALSPGKIAAADFFDESWQLRGQ